MTTELKPPPMPAHAARVHPDGNCYFNGLELMGGGKVYSEAQLAARDAQWLSLVGELQRDAERYRWLRATWLDDPDAGEDVAWSPIMHSCDEDGMDADIDAAIDAARGSKGGV